MDVVVVGSALVDMIVKTDHYIKVFSKNFRKYLSIPHGSKVEVKSFELHAGGSGHNVAVDLAKFGHHVSFVGKVGKDYLSELIINSFKEGGVDISNLKIVKNGEPGFSIIYLSEDGEKSIVVYNGRNLDLSTNDVPRQHLKNAKWFIFTSITSKGSLKFLEKAVEFSKKNNVKILANPSIRMVRLRRKELLKLIKNSDVAIMNKEEVSELTRIRNTVLSMKKLYKLGVKIVVVTLGVNGAVAYDGRKVYRQKGFKVKIIDSTGCGDSFTAAFLHYISKKRSIPDSLRFAAATSALELQRIGATNLPSEKDILNFMSKN